MSDASAQHSPPWRQESSFGRNAVHRWADLSEFHGAAQREDGFHVIADAHGGPLELLALGRPFEQYGAPVMVVFSGAITNRQKRTPPFASGRNLAPGLGVPLIAISDPTLSLDRTMNIGWYAGTAMHDVQSAVDDLLQPLATRLAGDLWLVGGSAGGFAALDMAHRLGRHCSAFVWNPQTSITEYLPNYAKKFAKIAFPRLGGQLQAPDWKQRLRQEARSWGRRVELISDVVPAQAPHRMLYLQGVDDWHMQSHCAPYLKEHGYARRAPGIWTRGEDRCIWIAETGEGHTPPAPAAIHDILSRLLSEEDSTTLQRTLDLDARPLFGERTLLERPEALQEVKGMIAQLVSWRLRGSAVEGSARELQPGYGRMRWEAVMLDEGGRPLKRSPQLSLPGRWELPELESARRLRITLVDGFGDVLVRRYLQIGG